MKRTLASGLGGLAAAFGSAVCCSGPLVLASMGVSGAALSAWRPWRPLFVLVSVGLLFLALRLQQRSAEACDGASWGQAHEGGPDGEACGRCEDPSTLRRTRRWLYVLVAISSLLLMSPRWAPLVF